MKTKLQGHAHAEQEVLYRRLEGSQSAASRSFAFEGSNEHQLVENQLEEMSADRDGMSETWMAELKVLRELIEHHVGEEETTGLATISRKMSSRPWRSNSTTAGGLHPQTYPPDQWMTG